MWTEDYKGSDLFVHPKCEKSCPASLWPTVTHQGNVQQHKPIPCDL